MNRRTAFRNITSALLLAGIASVAGNALAQGPSDVAAVTAANGAFYAALSGHDVGAMQKVWSRDADIEHIGPMGKVADIGWDAMKKDFDGLFQNFPELKVWMASPRIKVNGSTAWVSGVEHAKMKNKAGEASEPEIFGTSIFVKQGGHWLMVYHHASLLPK